MCSCIMGIMRQWEFDYQLKRSTRAKRLRIDVKADGTVSVIAPKRLPEHVALSYLNSQLGWIQSQLAKFSTRAPKALVEDTPENFQKYKTLALAKITSRIEHYNQFYGFKYSSIRVKNQKTTWGSCSTKKNLNFNYRLFFFPDEYLDYVVVHELCHLQEFNHSAKFWKLVAQTIPSYKELRKQINEQFAIS